MIFDEFSMCNRENKFDINRRLNIAKCNDPNAVGKDFGGLDVIFCGDFYQLPPVGGYGLFSVGDEKAQEPMEVEGRRLWKSHTTFGELLINHRWQNTGGFLAEVAPVARLGEEMPGHFLDKLNERCRTMNEAETQADPKAIWLAATNKECGEINATLTANLIRSGAVHLTLFAHHKLAARTRDPLLSEAQWRVKRRALMQRVPAPKLFHKGKGMGWNSMVLCIGSRVRCTRNTCTGAGIYQGAPGTVVGFGFPPGTSQHKIDLYMSCKTLNDGADLNMVPPVVFVQMDHAANPPKDAKDADKSFKSCFDDMEGVFCFAPQQQDKNVEGYSRFMPFLVPAHASTYHKCQGLTCRHGVVLSPPKEFNSDLGLTYVGLSRLTKFDGSSGLILLSPLFESHFTSKPDERRQVAAEYRRLRALSGNVTPAAPGDRTGDASDDDEDSDGAGTLRSSGSSASSGGQLNIRLLYLLPDFFFKNHLT